MTFTAKKMRLSALVEIFAGHPFRAKIRENANGQTAVVRTRDISECFSIAWCNLLRTEIEGRGEPNWLKINDLLLPSRGVSLFAGRIDEGIGERKAVADPNLFVLRRKDSQMRADYLAWWLNQQPTQDFFKKQAQGTTSLRSIGRQTLGKTWVMLPPLAVQKQIVALEALHKREMQLLEAKKQNTASLMQALAQNFLKS